MRFKLILKNDENEIQILFEDNENEIQINFERRRILKILLEKYLKKPKRYIEARGDARA